ncbi:MAG: FHA domain-containing protein, partial [Kiritimatiellae bacterium]|nr:FHA domain-containing protein [Kiritimatiellia bacterium]
MKTAGFGFGKTVLQLRLELAGRTICEGRTDAMPPEVRIGRAVDCEWRIPPTDKTASNHHARLYRKRGKWWVEDTASRNGLYCKGEKVSAWCLAAGDQVSIGDCVLSVSRPDERNEGKAERHRLEQLNGADAGRTVELDREASVIGSAPTCDIVCDDNLVSHRHAELVCKRDGSCWVKDLKSRNGTRVNRVQLKTGERMLRDGDVLSVAYVDFRFWDKNTVHTPSHLRLRAAVAALTVLACLAGWFFWSALHPSAAAYLKDAMKQAKAGRFDAAAKLAEEARQARHGSAYAAQIDDRLCEIRDWQATAVAWEKVQVDLSSSRWTDAGSDFTAVVKWDWNEDSAPRHQRRAEACKNLLDAFLAMRGTLPQPGEPDCDVGAEEFEEKLAKWETALAAAKAEKAMEDETWVNDFVARIPVGEDAPGGGAAGKFRIEEVRVVHDRDKVLGPLEKAGEAVAEEIRTALAEYAGFREAVKGLGADTDPLPLPAAACLARAEALLAESKARETRRKADQAERKYRVVRYAPLLKKQLDGARNALAELVKAEKTVAGNLEAVAALEPGWDKKLADIPDFKAPTDESAFKDYRKSLATANGELREIARTLANTHLAALRGIGFAPDGKTPHAIGRVLQDGVLDDILRFVDWRQEARTWGTGTNAIAGCAYDEILGCEYVIDFLNAYDNAETSFENWSPENLGADGRPCPVARRA